jgi:putative copper export protein
MLENPYVRITNNFLHDMATGTWAACLLVLWVLDREAEGMPAEAVDALAAAGQVVFWLLVGALVVVIVTGAIRLVYWRQQTPPEERGPKRRSLIIKHVAFAIIYGGGTWLAWTLLLT